MPRMVRNLTITEATSMQFSIIIPTKNDEANIRKCFESIFRLELKFADYEVIVVDNGSVDRTVPIAYENGAKLVLKSGLTISALRSCGARLAKGQILMFLDTDCNVRRACLSENYDHNNSKGELGIASC